MVTQAPQDLSAEEIERMLLADDDKMSEGQVLQSDHGGELTATITKFKDPDLEVVYDVRTGVASWFKIYDGNNSRLKMLSKRDRDGNRIFSMIRPENPPDALTPDTYCLFQKQHPRFEEMKAMGFRRCVRPGPLVGELGAEMHAKHAHPNSFDMVKTTDARRKDEERDLLQRQQTEAMLRLAGTGMAEKPAEAAPVAAEPELVPLPDEVRIEPDTPVAKNALCDICGEGFKSEGVVRNHKRLKKDDAHKAARGE